MFTLTAPSIGLVRALQFGGAVRAAVRKVSDEQVISEIPVWKKNSVMVT